MQQRPCSNLPPGSESKNANGGTSSICLLLDDAKDFVSSLFLIYEAATIDIRSRREPLKLCFLFFHLSKSDLFLEATGLIGSVVCVYWVWTCFLTWLSSFFFLFFGFFMRSFRKFWQPRSPRYVFLVFISLEVQICTHTPNPQWNQ